MNNRDSSVPASEADMEARIVAAGKTAPRVTPAMIDSLIRQQFYFRGGHAIEGTFHHMEYSHLNDGPIDPGVYTHTFCMLVLENGFVVTGESNCADPSNFDAAIGRDIAYRNARDKIWALEGYRLRSELAGGE